MIFLRVRLIAVAFFLLAVCVVGAQAGTITVGSAGAGNCIPFGCPWFLGPSQTPETGYQEVYAASAFGTAPISISSLTFYDSANPSSSITSATYAFTLSSTTAAIGGLNSSESANIGADHVAFWSGTLGGLVSGSITITGTTPFYFNPTAGENLLLTIDISGQTVPPFPAPASGFFDRDAIGSTLTSRAEYYGGPGGNNASGLETGFGATVVPEPLLSGLVGATLAGLLAIKRRIAP